MSSISQSTYYFAVSANANGGNKLNLTSRNSKIRSCRKLLFTGTHLL